MPTSIRKSGQPTRSDVHVNRPLTNISIAFMQDEAGFIADRVFPNIPVAKQSDRYFTYDRGYFNRDQMEQRAPSTESAGVNYTIDSTPTYFCNVWALHKDIDDQVRSNADSPIQLDTEATRLLTHQFLIRRERLWAANYFVTSAWTSEISGVANSSPGASEFERWDRAGSDPIEKIRRGKRVVQELTGFRPNKLTLGRPVFDALLDHPDIVGRLDRGQTTGPAIVQREALAALFELDEVLVMDAIYNSAQEGASNSHSFIGGKNALLTYSPASPGLMTPSAGYTFSWTGYLAANNAGSRIMRFRMDHLKSDRIEIEAAFDLKKIAADLGYFFLDAVS